MNTINSSNNSADIVLQDFEKRAAKIADRLELPIDSHLRIMLQNVIENKIFSRKQKNTNNILSREAKIQTFEEWHLLERQEEEFDEKIYQDFLEIFKKAKTIYDDIYAKISQKIQQNREMLKNYENNEFVEQTEHSYAMMEENLNILDYRYLGMLFMDDFVREIERKSERSNIRDFAKQIKKTYKAIEEYLEVLLEDEENFDKEYKKFVVRAEQKELAQKRAAERKLEKQKSRQTSGEIKPISVLPEINKSQEQENKIIAKIYKISKRVTNLLAKTDNLAKNRDEIREM